MKPIILVFRCHLYRTLVYTLRLVGIFFFGINLYAQQPINGTDTTTAIDYYQPQTLQYDNAVYREGIQSVMFYIKGIGAAASDPFLHLPPKQLPASTVLELSFDELGNTANTYSYKIIHCTADWKPSRLDPFEYIDGFLRDDITNYAYSFNTIQPYVNYRLEIPNRNTKVIVSGNYLLKVYANDNENDLVLTRRFVVYENLVSIDMRYTPSSISTYFSTHQRLEFEVQYPLDFSAGSPLLDFYTVILQNGRWDNALKDVKPTFLLSNAMVFSTMDQTLFAGGNEFRFFDTRCLRTACSISAQQITRDKNNKDDPNYHVWLKPDYPADRYRQFRILYDQNGKFNIEANNAFNYYTLDADYAYVHFVMPAEKPIESNGNIYVFGAFSDWQTRPDLMMRYNRAEKRYEGKAFLKQGVYDYQYVLQKDGWAQPDAGLLEGNYLNTENYYTVIIYQHLPAKRYDRVVGFLTVRVNR